MLTIEPTKNSLNFCSFEKKDQILVKTEKQEDKKNMLMASLAALAAAGATAVSLKKTTLMSYYYQLKEMIELFI